MKPLLIAVNVVLGVCSVTFCIASTATASPSVTARISQSDIQEICSAIGAKTAQPIISIQPAYSRYFAPGAIKLNQVDVKPKNEIVRNRGATLYERRDQVSVRVGDKNSISGDIYEVRKISQVWKILGKSRWIH